MTLISQGTIGPLRIKSSPRTRPIEGKHNFLSLNDSHQSGYDMSLVRQFYTTTTIH
jgi:hypothetical protein